jgi:hypothetical protein
MSTEERKFNEAYMEEEKIRIEKEIRAKFEIVIPFDSDKELLFSGLVVEHSLLKVSASAANKLLTIIGTED